MKEQGRPPVASAMLASLPFRPSDVSGVDRARAQARSLHVGSALPRHSTNASAVEVIPGRIEGSGDRLVAQTSKVLRWRGSSEPADVSLQTHAIQIRDAPPELVVPGVCVDQYSRRSSKMGTPGRGP